MKGPLTRRLITFRSRLSEGYKGDPDMNEKKFVANWFVDNERWVKADQQRGKGEDWRRHFRGPRDRLYRTGDLGRYIENGDVECTGRADDQVKIRGFRIELNDVDSSKFFSEHCVHCWLRWKASSHVPKRLGRNSLSD